MLSEACWAKYAVRIGKAPQPRTSTVAVCKRPWDLKVVADGDCDADDDEDHQEGTHDEDSDDPQRDCSPQAQQGRPGQLRCRNRRLQWSVVELVERVGSDTYGQEEGHQRCG